MGEAVARAADLLQEAGVAEPRREALEICAMLMRRPTGAVWLERDQPASAGLAAALDQAVRRRAAGWPQPYAAGAANFRGHWLLVDLVLPWVRAEGRRRGAPVVVADACTGSGAIAVALALEAAPAAVRVIATDCMPDALEVARANVAALGVADRVELRLGDLLQPLAGEPVDVVVSNPPYVAADEWDGLDASVRDFEPREALVAGGDGLAAIRALAPAARAALRPGGLLALEVDERRAGAAADLVAWAGFDGCEVLNDLFDRPRYVRAWRPADGSH